MSDKTKIEWTDATWNPLVGCSRVSTGCINCYAERHAYRFARQPGTVYEGTARLVNGRPTFTGRVNLNERVLDAPLRWRKPRRIFVNSMSDLFHESVPDATIDRIFDVMLCAHRAKWTGEATGWVWEEGHTFQVLTKRPERMRDYVRARLAKNAVHAEQFNDCPTEAMRNSPAAYFARAAAKSLPPFIWIGVSVEDQAAADARITALLQTPAAIRFLSCEPLLGPINLPFGAGKSWCPICKACVADDLGANHEVTHGVSVMEDFDPARHCASVYDMLHWVIAGGESGPRARAMHPDWARSLRDQCAAAGVPFFFKQWGEWLHETDPKSSAFVPNQSNVHIWPDEFASIRSGKKAAGRLLDGVEHNAYPVGA